MHLAKSGLVRVSLKACENLTDGIAKLNLNELKDQPELISSLKKQLIEENKHLKEEIEQFKSKIIEIQTKLPKTVYNEELPLKIPQVLSTNRLFGDALLRNTGEKTSKIDKNEIVQDANENSSIKETNTDKKENKSAKESKTKESKNKEGKSKTEKQVATKEPENIDASRLNLLVGKVVEVNRHPDAEKLYVEKIDLGEEQPRTVVSGLVDYIDVEKFQNKLVVALCNLKPSKLRGIVSEAMVMCASDKENNKVELLEPPIGSVPGDRIVFEKYPGEPDAQLNAKKKIWEQISVDLKTDDNKVACYKGDPFRVQDKGLVTAPSLANTIIR